MTPSRIETGAAIEVEVWTLPRSVFGDFLAGVPSPLSIGTIDLENGSSVHGFLVEAAGLEGATDISDHGSWRNYLASLDAASVA